MSDSSKEWEWYVDHIARWVDFNHAYKTMDTTYMETVMWVFKQMYEKGHIYKGLRVSLYCPHCSTPISNFEVAMDPDNYQDFTDEATTYKYQLVDEPETYMLAWSTTPWNNCDSSPCSKSRPDVCKSTTREGKLHSCRDNAGNAEKRAIQSNHNNEWERIGRKKICPPL